MRPWPNDPTVVHLLFVDHQQTPTAAAIDAAIALARRRGAHLIRTSALFPGPAEILGAAGFVPIDSLALLRLRLDDDLAHQLPEVSRRIRPLQRWSHHRVARVDQDAFGLMWGNDAAGIREIRSATPQHRARTVRADGRIVGFAISGAAAGCGYLQRVAVASDHRRRGIARDLVADSLRWMLERRRLHALVNTGVDNVAALSLYEELGFERLPDVLTIAERRLTE